VLVLVALTTVASLAACSSSSSSDDDKVAAFEMRPVLKVSGSVACSQPQPKNQPTEAVSVCIGANQKVDLGPAAIVTDDVAKVAVRRGTGAHKKETVVRVTLDEDGRKALETATAGLVGKAKPQNQIAILVDGRLIAAPEIASAVANGQVELGGLNGKAAAKTLASQIQAGLDAG